MAKKDINMQSWWNDIKDRLQDYPDWVVESGAALLIGVIIGFICRNWGRALFFFIISALITIAVLEHIGVMTVHAAGLRALIKDPDKTILFWINSIVTYVREHTFITVALIIGFLFGWRIGR